MFRTVSALLVMFVIACGAFAQDVPSTPEPDDVRDFLVFKDQAFIVGRPILVAGPAVSDPSWSPTGKVLTYVQSQHETNILNVQGAVKDQKPIPPERTFCVYSLDSGKSSQIIALDADGSNDVSVYWLAGGDQAIVEIRKLDQDAPRPGDKLYLLDADTASLKDFNPWEGTDEPRDYLVYPSPSQPYAFIHANFMHRSYASDGKVKLTPTSQTVYVSSSGQFSSIHLPDGSSANAAFWSEDGTRGYIVFKSQDESGKPKSTWYNFAIATGKLTPVDRPTPTDLYQGQQHGGLISVRIVTQPSTDGKSTANLAALWLETADPDSQNRLLLAGDASEGEVNHTSDCASYITQGSLYVRPISEVPKRRYTEALVVFNRSELLHQVRDDGLALIMYAADYDDIFPSSQANLSSILDPYLKDSSLLAGFVYTYPGGPISNITDPSNTQIGYVDGGDGRAIVYADGHAKWVPK